MNADVKMMHGRDWHGEDLAGWYLSEKLHGCRAYWDGAVLWSRGDLAIGIPAGPRCGRTPASASPAEFAPSDR